MPVASAKTILRMPVAQMKVLVKYRAPRKYSHEKTSATQRTKMNRTRVLVLREKSFEES
jgi:hypothetical protein